MPNVVKISIIHGTIKFCNLKEGKGVDKFTLWPVISNIGTLLLSPLGKLQHTVSNTKDFISRLIKEKILKKF